MPPKGKTGPELPVYNPPADLNPQVLVVGTHTLPDVLRFAETVYASVASRKSPHIDWAQISAEVGIAPSECIRLWRYIAYHWKGTPGRKRAAVDIDEIDLEADSDVEGAVVHRTPVVLKGGKGKRKGPAAPGEKRACLPAGALAFTQFSRVHRPQLKCDHPTLSFGDIAKELGRMWRELTDEQKASYTEAGVAFKAAADAKAARLLEKQTAGKRPAASGAGPSASAAGATLAVATSSGADRSPIVGGR
jgi:hypothetical protein